MLCLRFTYSFICQVPYGANVTRVIITLEEEFMVDRAFFAYSFLELVAEIGGYLGLFLGPNLLTVGSLISFLIGQSWPSHKQLKLTTQLQFTFYRQAGRADESGI